MKYAFTLAMTMALFIGVLAPDAMAQSARLRDFFERVEEYLEDWSGEVLETELLTSTPASNLARTAVELEAGGTPVALTDGDATIEEGELEIEADGDVEVELEGVRDDVGALIDGTGFVLINQGDTDNDADRDFVASASFEIDAGEVDEEFGELIPFDTTVEDVLITILLDGGGEVLDAADTILAVPGFAITREDDEGGDDEEEDEDGDEDED